MEKRYQYKPLLFYLTSFTAAWFFWFGAILLHRSPLASAFMLLGLISPAVIALLIVFLSNEPALKKDFYQKLSNPHRLRPLMLLFAILIFAAAVAVSILLSTLLGQSLNQFSFTKEFSFSGAGTSVILTILFTSVMEEIGWRGYGEDALAFYCSWFKEALLFGLFWALWHLPLFWINGTYHWNLRNSGILYAISFLISMIPLSFLITWVYIKNSRSLLATIVFHLFINILQAKIAMTLVTKCLETLAITIAAALVVLYDRDLFFEKRHIGCILQ